VIVKNSFMDKMAVKILKKYDLLNPDATSNEDFIYAKQHNVMFDLTCQTHDKCIIDLFDEFRILSKKKITDAFLYSLSTNNVEYRAGLSIYAIMQNFPFHKYVGFEENSDVCKFCGSSEKEQIDLNFFNQCRYKVGGIVSKDIYEFHFFLKQANLLNDAKPSGLDFRIFSDILKIICNLGKKDTPSILKKQLKSIPNFKSDEEQRISIIETLGYCSILENPKYKGFLTNYTILELAPRKKHSSDWSYPIDWWTGENGINEEAYNFWFGDDYPELCLDKIK
jgi:hypothetical protein